MLPLEHPDRIQTIDVSARRVRCGRAGYSMIPSCEQVLSSSRAVCARTAVICSSATLN